MIWTPGKDEKTKIDLQKAQIQFTFVQNFIKTLNEKTKDGNEQAIETSVQMVSMLLTNLILGYTQNSDKNAKCLFDYIIKSSSITQLLDNLEEWIKEYSEEKEKNEVE